MDTIKWLIIVLVLIPLGLVIHSIFLLAKGDAERLNQIWFMRVGISIACFVLIIALVLTGYVQPSGYLSYL